VALSVEIKAGEEDDFEREFREVARAVSGADGLMGQTLCRDAARPEHYLIVSDWSDRETFRRFEVSPEQDEATAPVRRHRKSVQMNVYDVVLGEPAPGE
jgi:heme-degrading monooxygenase HmoA